MIHCCQTTSGDYVAWINRGACFDPCPLRAVWMALMYEMGHIVSDDGATQ